MWVRVCIEIIDGVWGFGWEGKEGKHEYIGGYLIVNVS